MYGIFTVPTFSIQKPSIHAVSPWDFPWVFVKEANSHRQVQLFGTSRLAGQVSVGVDPLRGETNLCKFCFPSLEAEQPARALASKKG